MKNSIMNASQLSYLPIMITCTDIAIHIVEQLTNMGALRAGDYAPDDAESQLDCVDAAILRLKRIQTEAASLCAAIKQGAAPSTINALVATIESLNANLHGCSYLVSESFPHRFANGDSGVTRWVMDLNTGELVHADLQQDDAWQVLNASARAELLNWLTANEVRQTPWDYKAADSATLPCWAMREEASQAL